MNVNSTGIRARRAARYMEERFNAFLSPQTFQINRDVESHWVDLSVIGERGGTEVDEALFGSVTKHVLYETPSDVLVAARKLGTGETSARLRITAILRWCSAHRCGIYDHSDR